MNLNLKQNIQVMGELTITSIDTNTGCVISEDTHPNMILDSGLELLAKAISSQGIPLVSHLQLGGNSNPPISTDVPLSSDGQLITTPSEVFPVQAYYNRPNAVTFKCFIPATAANRGSAANYNEAVLLAGTLNPGLATYTYQWFARRTFNQRYKDNNIIFEITWVIKFLYSNI